jgi:hypothetical protein
MPGHGSARSSSSCVVIPEAANSTPAAASPAGAAAAATSAAATSTPTSPAAAASAATTAAASAAANDDGGQLYAAASIFLVEEIERGETDVGHFLVTEDQALIGRAVVRLRDVGGGYCGRGRAPRQRKTQSRRAECRYGGGFGCARLLRSLLHPWHVTPSSVVIKRAHRRCKCALPLEMRADASRSLCAGYFPEL